MRQGLAIVVCLAALTACSNAGDRAAQTTSMDVAEDAVAPAAEAPPPPATTTTANGGERGSQVPQASIPVSVPKIAYVYDFGFRLAADRIPRVQRRHADLCEKQGPQVCRILDMRQSGSEGDYASGSLTLAVAAPRARAFGAELAKLAGDAGGEQISSAISGEDLSKQIVDTEARLRARTVLRDRLMEVLATRKGTVAELVEAERGVAQVNEEIDQARSWLAEMQGRVDFSRVNISYTSGAPSSGGFMEPVRGALGSLGSILGTIVALAIVLLAVLIPLGLVVWAALAVSRRLRGSRAPEEGAHPSTAAPEIPQSP